MLSRKELVEDNDWVVVYEGVASMKMLQVKKGQWLSNKNGNFPHDAIIGSKFGSVIQPHKGFGTITVLAPNPQLWTATLPLRTQILFQTDIAMVLYFLDVKPGSVVVEAGTGSGSLSTSLARAVAPHGHLHTFEFNAERVKKALEDFKNNQIDHLITVRHRDVCAKGFPRFQAGVDAWFLDLPTPWLVLDDVDRSLRPQGRVCSFSPCVEQVQRTCLKLDQLRYRDIITIECLVRPLEVYRTSQQDAPIDLMTSNQSAPPKKLTKRVQQTSTGGPQPDGSTQGDSEKQTAIQSEEADEQQQTMEESDSKLSAQPLGEKRSRSEPPLPQNPGGSKPVGTMKHVFEIVAGFTPPTFVIKPAAVMRGHTGYLTFATKPSGIRQVKVADVTAQSETEMKTQ